VSGIWIPGYVAGWSLISAQLLAGRYRNMVFILGIMSQLMFAVSIPPGWLNLGAAMFIAAWWLGGPGARKRRRRLAELGAKGHARLAAMTARLRESGQPQPALVPR
jgi:hypothetical protein